VLRRCSNGTRREQHQGYRGIHAQHMFEHTAASSLTHHEPPDPEQQ
jgi:hypothetical protein